MVGFEDAGVPTSAVLTVLLTRTSHNEEGSYAWPGSPLSGMSWHSWAFLCHGLHSILGGQLGAPTWEPLPRKLGADLPLAEVGGEY